MVAPFLGSETDDLAYGPYNCRRMDKAKALHNADSYAWMALEYYWSTRCGMKFQDSIESIESDNTNDDPDVPLVLAPALPVLASKGIKSRRRWIFCDESVI